MTYKPANRDQHVWVVQIRYVDGDEVEVYGSERAAQARTDEINTVAQMEDDIDTTACYFRCYIRRRARA